MTLRGALDGYLEIEVAGDRRRAGPFDLLVAALGWTTPEPSDRMVGDTWDAFAQRLLVQHAARLARSL